MKSGYPSAEQVLDDLGDKVTAGLALMVAQVRRDLGVYRETFPSWVTESTDRGLLNWCHDRACAHVARIFDSVPEVVFVDRPPIRELRVGIRYRLQVKKHDIDGLVSTYPTPRALAFFEQEPPTLDGFEEIRLIAGYRWDAELREIGPAVLSLRSGREHVVWMHELEEPSTGIVTATPIVPAGDPRTPQIRMASDDARADGAEEG